MTLKLHYASDRGNLERERLVLKVSEEIEVGLFAIFRTYFQDDTATTLVTDTFWFPDKRVSAGDLVVVYSKEGTDNTRPRKDGSGHNHFFYWRRDNSLWDSDTHGPVLVQIATWVGTDPKDLDRGYDAAD